MSVSASGGRVDRQPVGRGRHRRDCGMGHRGRRWAASTGFHVAFLMAFPVVVELGRSSVDLGPNPQGSILPPSERGRRLGRRPRSVFAPDHGCRTWARHRGRPRRRRSGESIRARFPPTDPWARWPGDLAAIPSKNPRRLAESAKCHHVRVTGVPPRPGHLGFEPKRLVRASMAKNSHAMARAASPGDRGGGAAWRDAAVGGADVRRRPGDRPALACAGR